MLSRWDRGYVKRRFVEEAIKRNIQVECLVPSKFQLNWGIDSSSPASPAHLYYHTRGLLPLPSYVIPRLSANLLDYKGKMILRELMSRGIPILNDMTALSISSDKFTSMQYLNGAGLPIPSSYLLSHPITQHQLEYMEICMEGYPLIMKCTAGSKGESVWKVDSREDALKLLTSVEKDQQVVCQRFISTSSGRDIRCFVIGSHVIAGMMRRSERDFRSNVALGGEGYAIHVGDALAKMACDAARVAGLECAGVDCLIDKDTYRICELNGNPGCEGLERATGINVVASILEYVMDRIDKKRKNENGD